MRLIMPTEIFLRFRGEAVTYKYNVVTICLWHNLSPNTKTALINIHILRKTFSEAQFYRPELWLTSQCYVSHITKFSHFYISSKNVWNPFFVQTS